MDGQIRQLSSSLKKVAFRELNENEDKILENIQALREWVLQQPHLNSQTDDHFLLLFLRGSKHDVEKAKEKLDFYYTVRTGLSDYFINRKTDSHTMELIRVGMLIPLPKTDGDDGPRILLCRPGALNPSQHHIKELAKAVTMISDIIMHEDDNIFISGYIIVGDCSNVKPSHLTQYDPIFVRRMVRYYQDSSNARVIGIHFVNLPFGVGSFINFIKKFLNEDFKSRIHVHSSNMEALYEYVPKYLFPKEYNGDTSSIPEILDKWTNNIQNYSDLLKEEEQYGVDEKKRKTSKRFFW